MIEALYNSGTNWASITNTLHATATLAIINGHAYFIAIGPMCHV